MPSKTQETINTEVRVRGSVVSIGDQSFDFDDERNDRFNPR